MARRIDYFDDPSAPAANSLVPSVNVVVVNDAGEILLIRRTDNDNWALPGGAMDLGESLPDAAIRETLEETRELAFHIHNASDMPIYEAELPLPSRSGEDRVIDFVGLVPPGRARTGTVHIGHWTGSHPRHTTEPPNSAITHCVRPHVARLPPASLSCCDRTTAQVSHLRTSSERLAAHSKNLDTFRLGGR